MVRFVADENIDSEIVSILRKSFEVMYIAEENPGISDTEVLELCSRVGSVLLTSDKDFGDLVFRQGKNHAGVLLLRLPGISQTEKAQIVANAIGKYIEEIEGCFSVLTKDFIRIRHTNRL